MFQCASPYRFRSNSFIFFLLNVLRQVSRRTSRAGGCAQGAVEGREDILDGCYGAGVLEGDGRLLHESADGVFVDGDRLGVGGDVVVVAERAAGEIEDVVRADGVETQVGEGDAVAT